MMIQNGASCCFLDGFGNEVEKIHMYQVSFDLKKIEMLMS